MLSVAGTSRSSVGVMKSTGQQKRNEIRGAQLTGVGNLIPRLEITFFCITSAVPDPARILCHSNGLLKHNIHMKIYRVVPMYRYILFHGARLIVHTNS